MVAQFLIFSQVWPYLLGYHKYGSTPEEREHEDNERVHDYKILLAEWTNVEILLRQRTRVSETDRDSTAGSVGSKEDEFNETPDNDPRDTKNDLESPDSGNLTNGYGHNDSGENDPGECDGPCNSTPGENHARLNGTLGENSPRSELDNESGCYDCESGKLLNSGCENSPSCEECPLYDSEAFSEGHDRMTNGYHGNDMDNNVDETRDCTCGKERRLSFSRLSSYSVSFVGSLVVSGNIVPNTKYTALFLTREKM